LFKGNIYGDDPARNIFDVPIIAQWIRINPTRWRDRISLRLELYGCAYCNYSNNFKLRSKVIKKYKLPFQHRIVYISMVLHWYVGI